MFVTCMGLGLDDMICIRFKRARVSALQFAYASFSFLHDKRRLLLSYIHGLPAHAPLLAGTCDRLGLRLRGRLAREAPSAATGVGAVSLSILATARASAYAKLHGTAFPICR